MNKVVEEETISRLTSYYSNGCMTVRLETNWGRISHIHVSNHARYNQVFKQLERNAERFLKNSFSLSRWLLGGSFKRKEVFSFTSLVSMPASVLYGVVPLKWPEKRNV